ncbi:MAG: CBS domain-containing protein [Actinobacteria bacterium]|nr:CBS domain-containing protein [Actinomycetota bacterium]
MTDAAPSDDTVAAYMTTDVLCVTTEQPVPDAVRALVERGIDGAPVVDEAGRLVGMLSASDVMIQDAHVHLPTVITLFGMSAELPGQAARYDRDIQRALASKVSELMAHDPSTITADASMSDAATILHDADVSRLPVIDDDGRLIGIIARGDVLRYLVGAGSDGPH